MLREPQNATVIVVKQPSQDPVLSEAGVEGRLPDWPLGTQQFLQPVCDLELAWAVLLSVWPVVQLSLRAESAESGRLRVLLVSSFPAWTSSEKL